MKRHLLTLLLCFASMVYAQGQDNKTLSFVDVNYIQDFPRQPISNFGINYVYHGLEEFEKNGGGTPEEYIAQQNQKLCDIGIGWVRSAGPGDLTSLNWANVEPQRGVFDFALSDLRVKGSSVFDLHLLGNVDFSTVPAYAQAPGTYFDDTMYLKYLNKIVERYDGDGVDDMPGLTRRIKYWEIGNEVVVKTKFAGTPQDYAHVLKISYENIKANCPDCQVVIGGWIIGTGEEGQWQRSIDYFDQVLAAGGGNYFDIVNYHEYTAGCDFLTYFHVNEFKRYLAMYGFDKPMWLQRVILRCSKMASRSRGSRAHVLPCPCPPASPLPLAWCASTPTKGVQS